MSKLIAISLDSTLQAQMAAAAGRLTSGMRVLMQRAVAQLAEAAYNKAVEIARQRLDTTALEYIDALRFEQVGPGVFSVSLDESADWLENGMSSFSMKEGLLKNAKKVSRLGYRYRSIPMPQKMTGSAQGTKGDMLSDVKRLRKVFGDEVMTKDSAGIPLLGKIWSMRTDKQTGMTDLFGAQPGVADQHARFAPALHPNVEGIQKMQFRTPTRAGGWKYSSAMITFRTVSENPNSKSKWQHPGIVGKKILQTDVYNWAIGQLSTIMDEILKGS